MAAGKLFVVLGFAVLAIAAAGVTRREATTTNDKAITDLVTSAQAHWQDFNESFLKLIGFENQEQAAAKAKEEGKKVVAELDKLATFIQTSTADFENNAIVKDVRESATKLTEDWKTKHPETAADVQKLTGDAQNVLKKLQSLGDSQQAQNIKDLATKLLTEGAETIQKISKEAAAAVKN